MAESDLNRRLQAALSGWDMRRCENAVDPGTPDLHYIRGWVESKQLKAWPKRVDTVLKVDHYVPAQRAWHLRRCAAGGCVWVALEVAGAFHLYHADLAARHLGLHWTRLDCHTNAALYLPRWDMRAVRKFFVDYHE